jgi:hypothetical protein
MPSDLLAQTLATCIEQSLGSDTQGFQWDVFFRLWFREKGSPLFFLFKRHLGVTNAQYVELLSLLETHCVEQATKEPKHHLLFHTTEQMKSPVIDSINILLDVPAKHPPLPGMGRPDAARSGAAGAASTLVRVPGGGPLSPQASAFIPPQLSP